MLGGIFASPTPDQIATAATLADTGAGALSLAMNYTGEVINFRLVAENAAESRSQHRHGPDRR
ncbi:dihydroxyacetone kinase subunit DhaK [Streptomyces sp. 205]|uniref:Dihydroxyacetone kinase subunit DhaK n=1 Tax=Streptomyces coffeae TaxID=621382 RepID=A0ABS1NRU9_9ACTN|nr:dihydroxyacetone kinase subunit DhaK [Streptomyces coffeae]